MTQEQITIDAYSLPDLLKEVQQLVQEGYEVDFETNSGYPQQYATRFVVTMVQPQGQSIKVVAEDEILGDTETPKRGRKPKV